MFAQELLGLGEERAGLFEPTGLVEKKLVKLLCFGFSQAPYLQVQPNLFLMFGDGLLARRIIGDSIGGEIELDTDEGEDFLNGDKSHLCGKAVEEADIGQLIRKAETIMRLAPLLNFGHVR